MNQPLRAIFLFLSLLRAAREREIGFVCVNLDRYKLALFFQVNHEFTP